MAERRPIKVISKLPTSHDAMHKKSKLSYEVPWFEKITQHLKAWFLTPVI